MSEREYKALRSVPASTWMEGFCVTKQMEEACMCLMSGEVSVTAQSQTVSRAHRFPLSVAEGTLFLYIFINDFQFPLKSLPSLKRESPQGQKGGTIQGEPTYDRGKRGVKYDN